jgi:hypothetical protein
MEERDHDMLCQFQRRTIPENKPNIQLTLLVIRAAFCHREFTLSEVAYQGRPIFRPPASMRVPFQEIGLISK